MEDTSQRTEAYTGIPRWKECSHLYSEKQPWLAQKPSQVHNLFEELHRYLSYPIETKITSGYKWHCHEAAQDSPPCVPVKLWPAPILVVESS